MSHAITSLLAQSASVQVDNGTASTGMSIVAWLVLGLIAGFIASKIINKSGDGIILDIILGIIGAMVGGFIMRAIGAGPGVSGVNLYSIFVAVIGAIIVLLVYHTLRGTSGRAR
jgi:uncharacterized membrane protein YeaQ/YmgE (transglycosylase-associated protein family)